MHHVVAATFRKEHARVYAFLVRHFGDFQLAEDALQDAFLAALQSWPRDGVPDRPAAWITAVARNRGTSGRRRRAVAREKEPQVAAGWPTPDPPDARLDLLFTCCHPALSPASQVVLTLRAVGGLPVPAIARLLLVPEATITQRLTRAHHRIAACGIPVRSVRPEELESRVEVALSVVYLLFTEGYATTDGLVVLRPELCEEALRLASLLVQLVPGSAEARSLRALLLFHHARRLARVDTHGELVALEDQDPSQWDTEAIRFGLEELDAALRRGPPGPYQIQAAIAALHATSRDWSEIALLYAELARHAPSLPVEVARGVAVGMASGPDAGLLVLAPLPDEPTVLAARADLLRRAGRKEARAMYTLAIGVARNARERAFLERQQSNCPR